MDQQFDSVMIDLETLGLSLGASVIQIGVVFFNTAALASHGTRSYSISANVSDDGNGLICQDTVAWWKETDEALYLELMERSGRADSIRAAIEALRELCVRHGPKSVWAKHPSFDIAQLNLRMQSLKIEPFWKFYRVFDCATVTEVVRIVTGCRPITERKADSRAHDGQADAQHQVRHLHRCIDQLRQGWTKPLAQRVPEQAA